MTPLIVLGSGGRIGRMLRLLWAGPPPGLCPVWHARSEPADLLWDMTLPCPGNLPSGAVFLVLAGVTDSRTPMDRNATLALAACAAAADSGARHVFLLSSGAVYGPGSSVAMAESLPMAPANPYGLAKQRMEEQALACADTASPGLTILRLGNLAGADALLGRMQPGLPVVLDPVPGGTGGPVRSYIGPRSLADVLARLAGLAAGGADLPRVLNIAAGAVSMADLLNAAGQPWHFGPPNPAVVARVVLDTALLQSLCPLPPEAGQASAMVAEWRGLGGKT